MANAVVILGAGASAPFGVPTLLHVFKDPYARRYIHRNRFLFENLQEKFWRPRGHTVETSHLSLSIEEVLTVVRDFENQAYSTPPLFSDSADSERFRKSLYVLIKKAIYDGKSTCSQHLNPVIQFMRENYRSVTWASFNWDCIFESSYYYSSGRTPFTRSNPQVVIDLKNWRNTYSKHIFLKLHGGINWWYEDESIVYLPFGSQPDLNERWRHYESGENQGHPVILEPSYYKYQDPMYELIKEQWQEFVKRLMEADLVLIIGYSLPEADTEARTALTIGFQSNPNTQFVVVDKKEWVCNRYKRLLGSEKLVILQRSLEDIGGQLPELIGERFLSDNGN